MAPGLPWGGPDCLPGTSAFPAQLWGKSGDFVTQAAGGEGCSFWDRKETALMKSCEENL